MAVRKCFNDSARDCTEDCKAYCLTDGECNLIKANRETADFIQFIYREIKAIREVGITTKIQK